MAKQELLDEKMIKDIKHLGTGTFSSWLNENGFKIDETDNLFSGLIKALEEGTIQIGDIDSGISELEENGRKKIFLFQSKNFKTLILNKTEILIDIKKEFGYSFSNKAQMKVIVGDGPTFVNLTMDDYELKLKWSEKHYNKEDDPLNLRYILVPVVVNVYFIINLKNGFTQLRFDFSGEYHTHRADSGNPSEQVFHQYYKDLVIKIFPQLVFQQFNLTGVANYIATNETARFLMKKEVTTVSNGDKQTYSTARKKKDVRFSKARIGAAANDDTSEWQTEDITGYWLASHSEKQLKKDLFMRVYRRESEIHVQRGCLKKELDYGIEKIREIQKAL